MATEPATDPWQAGDAYERYMGRWSRCLARRFLPWLDAPAGGRWLDVGCGTGALALAILEACAPSAVIGVDPSAGFLAEARRRLPAIVALRQGRADRLPLADDSCDVVVSALVLNFVPDVAAALRDMVRVTVRGGRVAACVWDYGGRMGLVRPYWDAAARLGLLAPGQHQGERFPICTAEALRSAFDDAGLQAVDVMPLDMTLRLAGFDDYWRPFLGGQGQAPAHAMSLDRATRRRLRDHLRSTLPTQADGSMLLDARAWAVQGTVMN